MAKVKIAGIWAGVLEVEPDQWTVSMLRAEVAKRSNNRPESINLICSGKVLKDGDGCEKLSQLGIKNNSKILASRVSMEEANSMKNQLMAEEERMTRLARVKAAAMALAQRHTDGLLPEEEFDLELEDQSGQKVQLGTDTDRRAIMMGLMLHANGKRLIRKQNYRDALEVLAMGEESFSLCNQKVLELIDNVPILQIDMVWCYFMLRDVRWLSDAGMRLEMAREGIERSHGKDSSRVRLLQAGRYPELALHLRLQLLEGVVAYHNGQFDKARKALTSAQAKFSQLEVRDEVLTLVLTMGFKEREAKRALRMTNQDVSSAIDFLIEERTKKLQKKEEDIRRLNEIRELKRYGTTASKKAVDLERLSELVDIGFEKELAAEALRRNENDTQKALDDLTNPETNSVLQVDIESRKRKRQQQATEEIVETLMRMGFNRSRVAEAIEAGGRTVEAALQILSEFQINDQALSLNDPQFDCLSSHIPGDTANSSANGTNDLAGPSNAVEEEEEEEEERDVEMEDELASELANGDTFTGYDIEVTKEGEAISEYLVLLDSVCIGEKA